MNAVLVMESRGVTPGTRGFQFSDAWTRLYKTDDYFVDMRYVPGKAGGKLQGQVLKTDGKSGAFAGSVRLGGETWPIDDCGQFSLSVDSHPQSIILDLNTTVLELDGRAS